MAFYIFLLIQLFVVSFVDFKLKKIHNFWTLINIILFLGLFAFSYLSLSWSHFIIPLLIFISGYILYLGNIVGAGDVKYLFGLTLLLPPSEQLFFIEYLAYSTLVVASFLFISSVLLNFSRLKVSLITFDFVALKSYFGAKFSFAPVILVAWLWMGWIKFLS